MKRMLTVYSSQESDKDWTWPLHWVILLPRGSTGPQESSRLGDALPSWVNTSHKSSSVRKTTGSHTSVHVAKYQLHQQPWKASKCSYILVTWLEKKYIQENQGYTAMPLRRTILGFHVVEVTTTLTLPHLHESANSQMMVPILDLENQQRSSPRKPSCFPTICTYLWSNSTPTPH